MSDAADRLERLACFYGAQKIVRLPELEARERDAALLRNVAALVRAMSVYKIESWPEHVEQALAKLQEGE